MEYFHLESSFHFSLIKKRAIDIQVSNPVSTFLISDSATVSVLIHSLLGTPRTVSPLAISLLATNRKTSGTIGGYTGVFIDTTPSSHKPVPEYLDLFWDFWVKFFKLKKKKDRKGFERVLTMADTVGLEKKKVSKHNLNMITVNRPHQGLILDASLLEMVAIKELKPISIKEQKTTSLWVALDEVTDPQNLGAIIRAAYLLGASGIVLCAKNCVPLSGVVRKASVGSLELMELRSCKNMMQFLASSIENGWRILGGSISSRAIPLHVLVLGSEGTELRLLVERSDTELVKIPRNIPFNIVVGQDEDAECDNSISGQNYRSAEIKDLVDLRDSDNVSNFEPKVLSFIER
ncbi:hypothetical protein CQW23_17290 [Capsicum baccatum]|uniref:tRNA/rRNA methyltransferase SpoU type domain-containing protein n=1 Tax=Capsicum baccatum TaxID=33114 RepID=A0A2G2WDE9_CAPBA|nr:hypothetical protein CQW23_17290 [Capsicum baccatum]